MSVLLPEVPMLADVSGRLVDFGATLAPPLGGASQQIARLGDRYAYDITLPSLSDSCARNWIGARLRAKARAETLVLLVPRVKKSGLPAGALVQGGSQLGTTLDTDGLGAGTFIPAFTPFSFQSGGRHYLHMTTDDATANGGGAASLSISPMLRVSPADNLALDFLTPKMEGFLEGTTVAWDLRRLKRYGTSFTLVENE